MQPKSEISIFLVDDNQLCLELYKMELMNLGYNNIQVFENSADCLNQLTKQPVVVFLDYHMDNLNGIDILKKIKRFNPNIPVIFISGQEDLQVAVNALKYGAFDYIIKKDFTREKIQTAMEKIMWFRETLQNRNKKGFFKKAIAGIGLTSFIFFLQRQISK